MKFLTWLKKLFNKNKTCGTVPLEEGDRAPDFTLPSNEGREISLSDFHGRKNVILYFYPKDNTRICTAETKSFQDEFPSFEKYSCQILGVSSDGPESHRKFSEKLGLSFPLLSDPQGAVRKLYRVPNFLGVIPGRTTFLIDKEGVIRQVWSSQLDAESHVELSLAKLINMGESVSVD